MLVLREKDKEGADWQAVYVVDFHHHMGKNNSVKNLSPSAPDGTYSFLRNLLFGNQWKAGFFKEVSDNPEKFKFEIPPEFSDATLPSPPVRDIIKASGPQASGMDNSFSVDQVVVFPMDDTYSAKEIEHYKDRGEPTPLYSLSNSRLSQIVTKFPNSLRFIGFGRVSPQDPGAEHEVERMVNELGMRGLKLHPKSEFFELEGEEFKQIIRTCASMRTPIILHTSYISDVRKITDSVNEVIMEKIKAARGKSLEMLAHEIKGIKIVLGHCGWHASPDLWNFLTHPNIYGEISGIRSEGVTRFFTAMKNEFDIDHFFENTIPEIIGRRDKRSRLYKVYAQRRQDQWSEKVMYGSDFPFMDHNQSIDVFASIFSEEFPGDVGDIRRILGLNALGLLKRSLPGFVKKGEPRSFEFSKAIQHSSLAQELISRLKTGFDSVVFSPHIDGEGTIDGIDYDFLNNSGEVVNIFLTMKDPMPLLQKKDAPNISGLVLNSETAEDLSKIRTQKISKKDIGALVEINELRASMDFELD